MLLDMPELKIIKLCYTQCLGHECCVEVIKVNYCANVNALNSLYEETHEPEALEISDALCKKSTVSAKFLLDYVCVASGTKLSKTLQIKARCNNHILSGGSNFIHS